MLPAWGQGVESAYERRLPVIAAGCQHHAEAGADAPRAAFVAQDDAGHLAVFHDQLDHLGRGAHVDAKFAGGQHLCGGKARARATLSGFDMALQAGADVFAASLHLHPFVRGGEAVAVAIGRGQHFVGQIAQPPGCRHFGS